MCVCAAVSRNLNYFKGFLGKLTPSLSYFSLFKKATTFESVALSRDFRIIADSKEISRKLGKELDAAQKQKNQEKDGAHFKYLKCDKNNLDLHSEKLTVGKYSVGVCHAQGRRSNMEDEHLASSFNLCIGEKKYPIELFGVFDGHGGSKASSFVKKNLEKELKKALLEFNSQALTDEGVWNALKLACVRLSKNFKEDGSGTTATMTLMLDGKLWTANVGDSRTILENKGKEILQLSEDASPDDPRYRKSIEKRGGEVLDKGIARINGILAVGRAIGDHSVGRGMTGRPKITMIPLSEIKPGSHLVLACDGIYDVASTRQIGRVVSESKEEAASLAENIVYSAYQAGSGDNLSALVISFPGPKQIYESPISWVFSYFNLSNS